MKEFSKVLVTGGAGFIGSYLVNELVRRGYNVVVLDNFRSGRLENLKQHLGSASANYFKLVEGDVRNDRAVRDAMDGVDAVVHLAALVGNEESVNDPVGTHDVNVTGTLSVLKEALGQDIERFVFSSSAAVYGEGNRLPLNEDCPSNPISPYAASKVSAECYCNAFHRSYGLETVVLRYFNVYGSRREHNPYSNVIARFLKNALSGRSLVVFGNGQQTRDFIYIDDVVEATILALESRNTVCETLNVCTGKPTTINDLVRIVSEVTECNLQVSYDKPRKGDVRSNYGDPAKAKEILGFRAKTGLREGLKQLVCEHIAV